MGHLELVQVVRMTTAEQRMLEFDYSKSAAQLAKLGNYRIVGSGIKQLKEVQTNLEQTRQVRIAQVLRPARVYSSAAIHEYLSSIRCRTATATECVTFGNTFPDQRDYFLLAISADPEAESVFIDERGGPENRLIGTTFAVGEWSTSTGLLVIQK